MTLAYQRFTAVLLLIYGSLFLNGVYYCLSVFGVPPRECWSLNVREFLASKQITELEHPPYSSDLAPSDFFSVPEYKLNMKGRHFVDADDIKNNTAAALKANSQNQLQNCFEEWNKRWHRCIASQGYYFEGDHSDTQQ
jgi:hypothetical protein